VDGMSHGSLGLWKTSDENSLQNKNARMGQQLRYDDDDDDDDDDCDDEYVKV
jgi:hypothetical protein